MDLQEIKAEIEGEREDNTLVKAIIEALRPHNGKKLTVRHEAELKKVDSEARIVKKYGWTALSWSGGYDLMLSRTEKNVVIDTDWIVKENARCFSALEKRNAFRDELLRNDELLERTAKAITAYQEAARELKELLTHENFDSSVHVLNRLAGFDT